MQIKLVNILTYVPIFSYKSDVTNRHAATDGTHRGSNKISRGNSIDSWRCDECHQNYNPKKCSATCAKEYLIGAMSVCHTPVPCLDN